jgi:hypothetical protein
MDIRGPLGSESVVSGLTIDRPFLKALSDKGEGGDDLLVAENIRLPLYRQPQAAVPRIDRETRVRAACLAVAVDNIDLRSGVLGQIGTAQEIPFDLIGQCATLNSTSKRFSARRMISAASPGGT